MRVFCSEHKRGFFAPRQSPIKCENKGHLLGELDFDGEAKAPVELRWQYCCNCEHFCAIDVEQGGLERCPVCSRPSSMVYLCDRCYTISFESNTPLQTKNFTLTSEGAPQPSCPGCLHATSADLREHTCDALGASLITALNSCPICRERLDVGPSFPSSVAHYLKRTKAANKVIVTFDYESELFVPVDDGEFVLVSNGNAAMQPIVLPRSVRFATRRDFYEIYQDYYHCTKPDAGQVNIVEPATVAPVTDGWKLDAPGILEVLEDHPQKKASADTAIPEANTPAREEPGLSTAAMNESRVAPEILQVLEDQPQKKASADTAVPEVSKSTREEPILSIAAMKETPAAPCLHCGSLIETRYAFCWKCGNSLTPKNESPIARSTTMPLAGIATDEDDVTAQHDVCRVDAPIFSWALAREPVGTESTKGSISKLIAIAAVVLALVSLGLFMLTRSAFRKTTVTDAQPVAPKMQFDPNVALGGDQKAAVAEKATPQIISTKRSEDDALEALRERRIGATSSDWRAILQAFANAEKQYPNDYRFPYERAKLAIMGSKSTSHDEAFAALSLAAQRAIKAGKAHEMLEGLKVDVAGDFHRLSHGHHEWKELLEVLKNKDTNLLSARARF